jgi:hypothetical protein
MKVGIDKSTVNDATVTRECIHGGVPWYCLKCENARLKEHLARLVKSFFYMAQFVPEDDQKKRIAMIVNEASVELAEDL